MRPPSADDLALVDQLQSRIDALEYDNERLRAVNHVPDASPVDVTQLEAAQKERDEALSRISDLEASLSASEYAFNDAQRQVSSLEGEYQKTIKALEDQRSEHETIISTLQAQVDEHAALVKTLQTELSEQEVIIQENAALVNSRGEEITTLTKRLEDVSTELRIEKQDMGAQIDELRMAGQVGFSLIIVKSALKTYSPGNHCAIRGAPQRCRHSAIRTRNPDRISGNPPSKRPKLISPSFSTIWRLVCHPDRQ